MCMDNESGYEGCSDHLFIDNYVIPQSITSIIEETLGAAFTDHTQVARDITALLDRWHTSGLMIPDPSRHYVWEAVQVDGKYTLQRR